jgi:Leucine-rich repeat (LRR) protein
MKITIRPDPDCIELIRSGFRYRIICFLKSVGVPEKNAEHWESTHILEINENSPLLVDVFNMKCYLPDGLFAKPEWVFKFVREELFNSFVISGNTICCVFFNTEGLEYLPENLLNLSFHGYEVETLNENFQGLLNLQSLKSVSFTNFLLLRDISLLENLVSLQSLELNGCESLTDIWALSGLVNLQSLHINGCKFLEDISPLSGLVNLKSLNLRLLDYLGGNLIVDICSLSALINLQSLVLCGISNSNLSCLSRLFNLESLYLGGCGLLEDISGLSGLINLQTISLGECKLLTDITPLSCLQNLKSLSLFGLAKDPDSLFVSDPSTLLSDVSCLSNLLNLQSLDLSQYEFLNNINCLSKLLNLELLRLGSCYSLEDISGLSGLLNLQILDLSGCSMLVEISGLSNLKNLRTLNLRSCKSVTDISSLAELSNLQSLDLGSCESLTDISSLAGLLNLQTLNLNGCYRLTEISSLSGLFNLQKLDLEDSLSLSLSDNEVLSRLVNLRWLRLNGPSDISSLSGLLNLRWLDLRGCRSSDINSLSSLLNLKTLLVRQCGSLTDISGLSGLLNLQTVDLSDCESLSEIGGLFGAVNLQTLNLERCKRIKSYSPLRNCLALKDLKESNMHPGEFAELLCFLAVQRKDISFISEKAASWLQELKLGLGQKHSSANDLACSLAQGLIMANLDEESLSFHQTLLNHPDVGIAPWKIWSCESLKIFGWDVFNYMAELNKPCELTFGAIGGISSCLPSLEGDPAQIAWAKKWISEIHSLHNTNPSFLKPAAAEWCLALKRLGENELLREWIEKFTDPSDPSALDPINKVFSAYALDLNDSESALEYALKINDPKLRDESILNLVQQFIKEGETTKAGEFLFLLTQIESRTQLAFSLAEDAAYLKIDENAHRLLAACGDCPQSLASILDKLRLANPASEILKIMHEKLSDQSRSEIPASLIMQVSNSYTNTLLKIKDPIQLEKIQQAIESVMKSS